MYNKEAHEKAADEAMKLLDLRGPLRLGEPSFFVNVRCSEPIIEALQPLCPLKWDRLADVTIGIGAGFSQMGEVCGALSGAIICIGLDLAGRYRDTAVLRLLAIQFTQKIMRDFAKEYGAVRCKELLGGMDISGCLIPGDENFAAYWKAKREGKLKPCREMMRWAIMYPLPSEQEDLHPPL
jgi:C_GCAxxG_C_C family probable redox protein